MKTSRQWVVLDFETRSLCELKKCGAYVYSRHPTTEILTLGYAVNTGPATYISPSQIAAKAEILYSLAEDPNVVFVCHNAGFERNIWREIMVGKYGWPDLPIERWHDTQAVALHKGLPAKLEVLCRVLNLSDKKDMEGNKLTLSLSKMKRGVLPEVTPDILERVGAYVVNDVKAETRVLERVKGFTGNERAVWEMDQRINDRGVLLDRDYIENGMAVCNTVIPKINTEFEALVGCRPTQRDQFLTWLFDQGVYLGNLKRDMVEKLLGDEEKESSLSDQDEDLDPLVSLTLPEHCARALRMRQTVNSASVKKLPAMLNVMGDDHRARGLLQYHGAASTGRWAGRLLQPHNFPRSVGFTHDVDDLVSAIMSRDVDYLTAVYSDPIKAVSGGLRHALIATPGTEFHLGDYSQIEARVVLALAGAKKGIKAFLEGSPYIQMAEQIYHRSVDKKTNVAEYTIGKNTILGCGFQMGAATFHSRYCINESLEFAQRAISAYREDFAPEVPKLWYALQDAACDVAWGSGPREAYGIEYRLEGEWLTARLPSGRKIYYYAPQTMRDYRYDAMGKPTWTSLCYKQGKLLRRAMYGGLLTENIVQALARDLLVEAMFRCEAAGLSIVLTVHDELVDESRQHVRVLEQCMTERSEWAKNLNVPINVESMTTSRYRK